VAVVVLSYSLFSNVYNQISANDWTSTKARVTDIAQRPKGAILHYEYSFGENRYSASRLAYLSKGSIPDRDFINSNFVLGDEIDIFVNPRDPKEAIVLKRSVLLSYIWKHLFSIMAIVIVMLFNFKQRAKNLTSQSSR